MSSEDTLPFWMVTNQNTQFGTMSNFSGLIDDVYIFNRTLSKEQILVLYNGKLDLIVSNETKIDDIWSVAVTPNDGYGDGTTTTSNSLTVINAHPTTPSSLTLTSPVYVSSKLNSTALGSTDLEGDSITYYYEFYNINDSSTVQARSTNGTYLIQTSDAHNEIRVRAWAYDGNSFSSSYNESRVNISNSVPATPSSLTLTDPIYVTTTLTATAGGSTDTDLDTITYYYEFYNIDDSTIIQANSTTNTYLIQTSDAHDEIRVRTWAYDGRNSSSYIETRRNVSNSIPTSPTVSISTPGNTNYTTQNITASITGSTDTDTDNIYNITDWRLNGTSIAVLNMPFDINISSSASGAVRDYSTYENNGTLGGGTSSYSPSWSSSCIVGGCYNFDGIDDYIETKEMEYNSNSKISISAWIYPTSGIDYETIVTKRTGTQTSFIFRRSFSSNDGKLFFGWTEGGTFNSYATSQTIPLNAWTHVGVSFDWSSPSSVDLFINGTKYTVTRSSGSGTTPDDPNVPITIGRRYDDEMEFIGKIDEVMIFNRSLSSDQFYALYEAGLTGKHLEIITNNETQGGDNWSLVVTATDTIDESSTVVSDNLTIVTITCPDVTSAGIKSFTIKNASGTECLKIDTDGDFRLIGGLTTSTTIITAPTDSFEFKTAAGDVIAYVDPSCTMVIEGTRNELESSISKGTGEFLIKDAGTGNYIFKVDSSGNIYATGYIGYDCGTMS